jgi:myo-inositol-1(or 4)-monophosphatase
VQTSLPPIDHLLAIALHTVTLVEARLLTHPPTTITDKSVKDPVTDVDIAIERLVRGHLHQTTPQVAFLGEEEGGDLDAPALWVLDPIDGTANYHRGLPLCGISLALIRRGRPVLGVIGLPMLGHRYWASVGHGAWRDGTPITAATTTDMDQAIVAIGDYGFGDDVTDYNDASFALHRRLAVCAQRVRMLGSAAVDLALVADGTLDASITLSNNAWDMAAGSVIAREAGALVIDRDGTTHGLGSQMAIATAAALREPILTITRQATHAILPRT